ncbi:DUF1643 domain-containing protein [Paenibacillus terrae]|uniref:DUF1643 domain-containing protein n=1 Tax=Paenibacillus terrae TaxID=159743 RepID=UPI0006979469|nr:DUF1643 domain-containing protein [Paenibacillus terrae]
MVYTEEKIIESTAVMADNYQYRYRLTRIWDRKKEVVGVIMLNPSKANSLKTDNTIMNLTNYLIEKGYGGVDIVNMYAYMCRDPKKLKHRDQSFEALNNDYITQVADKRNIFIIAWRHKENIRRKREIENLLLPYASKLRCFEDNEGKSPRHPLHISDKWKIVPYSFRFRK